MLTRWLGRVRVGWKPSVASCALSVAPVLTRVRVEGWERWAAVVRVRERVVGLR